MARSSVELLALAGRGGYGRDVKARRGAAALMAAAAVAAPTAHASIRGATTQVGAGLGRVPLVLPGPMGAQVVGTTPAEFAAALGPRARDAYAYADQSTNTVHVPRGAKKDRFAVAHEMAHLFDYQALTDADRTRFTKMLRAPSGPWEADNGAGEWFADYYAAAATGYTARPTRGKGGALVLEDIGSYADLGPRRIKRFARAMDGIARQRNLTAFKLP